MNDKWLIFITLASSSSIAEAEVQRITGDVYAGISDNAILLLLATQLAQVVWHMGKWIVDKYFREQQDKDAEVKKLKAEFHEFREEMSAAFSEIKSEMKHMGRLPSEDEIMKRLTDRMEFMVYKAAKELGIRK